MTANGQVIVCMKIKNTFDKSLDEIDIENNLIWIGFDLIQVGFNLIEVGWDLIQSFSVLI